jgi:aminopeptidase N
MRKLLTTVWRRKRFHLSGLELAPFLAAYLAATLTAAPLPRPYAVEHYEVHLTPDLAAQRIAGEATLHLRSRIDLLDAIELDAGSLEIASVVEGSHALYFEHNGSRLIIDLAAPAHLKEERSLTIRYIARAAKGLVFFPDQVYTSFFTHDWLPSNDRPDDRATLRLLIDPPPHATVAASGRFDGTAWLVESPTPPFLFAFAVGDFAESTTQAGGITLRTLGKASVNGPTADAVRFFADRTGHPYPGAVYTQVFCHGKVEQEAVGLTLLPESYGEGFAAHPEDLWLLAHELAHQWYAVGIQCKDWSDFWLNEGLATFMADAFLENRFGKPRYAQEIQRSRELYEAQVAKGADRPLSFTGWQTSDQVGGAIPYHKGALFLAELRRQLTDVVFWKGLRLYTNVNWNKPVTSDDFEKAMDTASHKNLTKLFARWVF